MSSRIMEILKLFSPKVETYSIDEAFLDLSQVAYSNLTEYCQQIRNTVRQWTGIPVSIGVSQTKTLAKLANKMAKQSESGIFILWEDEIERSLKETPIEDVWGVGRGFSITLRINGIQTAWQLRNAPDGVIKQELGVVGLRIALELRGMVCLPLQLHQSAKKSLMVSRSFSRPVESLKELKEAIALYTSQAGKKLRRQELAATAIRVFAATSRFVENPASDSVRVSLPVTTNDTGELLHYALIGTEAIYREGLAYKKAGVIMLRLIDEHIQQLHLWDDRDRDRYRQLMESLDLINNKMGKGSVGFAVAGLQPSWLMKCERRSPRYTTCWEEIPRVKAL